MPLALVLIAVIAAACFAAWLGARPPAKSDDIVFLTEAVSDLISRITALEKRSAPEPEGYAELRDTVSALVAKQALTRR